MKRVKDDSGAPDLQAQREGQSYILSLAEEWVLPAASTEELEEREFGGRIGSEYAHGQQARPSLC